MTVLYVDDDPDDQEIFTEAIHMIDKTIVCLLAANGYKAMDILSNDIFEKPDYIFLDINMPLMDGRIFLQKIKAIPALVTIPVIMYSTTTSSREMLEFQKLGAREFLIKPNNFTSLVKSLTQVLQQ